MPVQPASTQIHVNKPLTNTSVAFVQSQDRFIATQVFPIVPVEKQGDLYFVYDREFFLRSDVDIRTPGTEGAVSGYEVSTQTYFAHERALSHDIDDQIRTNSDSPLNPDRDATLWLTQSHMITREIEWVNKFFSTSIWNADTTPGTTWDNSASDPVSDIRARERTLEQNTGQDGNTFVAGRKVFDDLIDHPDILDRIKHNAGPGNPAVANASALAAVLSVARVLVARATRNTAEEGETISTSFIGGTRNALLVHAAPSPSLMVPSGGYTISWTGLLAGGVGAPQIERFRLLKVPADRIRARMAYAMELVASELGEFFSNAVAA